MIDTFQPLDLGEAGVASEDPAYAWSWAGRHLGEVGTGEDGGPAVYSNS
jgi:homogentisate 1,2-dioxygenase